MTQLLSTDKFNKADAAKFLKCTQAVLMLSAGHWVDTTTLRRVKSTTMVDFIVEDAEDNRSSK